MLVCEFDLAWTDGQMHGNVRMIITPPSTWGGCIMFEDQQIIIYNRISLLATSHICSCMTKVLASKIPSTQPMESYYTIAAQMRPKASLLALSSLKTGSKSYREACGPYIYNLFNPNFSATFLLQNNYFHQSVFIFNSLNIKTYYVWIRNPTKYMILMMTII